MNISVFASGSHVYSDCEYVKGYAFRNLASGEESAHFAEISHIVTAVFAILRDSYALLLKYNHMLMANLTVLRDCYANFAVYNDCFECLSPVKYRVT